MKDKYPVNPPLNAMEGIVQEFLEGAPFTEQLCDKVASTYRITNHPVSYKACLGFVKGLFSQCKHGCIAPDVYVINTSFEFDPLQAALMIRLINLCHHGECIIVLNEVIVYIPKPLRRHSEEEIRIHTHKRIQSVIPSKLSTWFKGKALPLSPSHQKDAPDNLTLAAT